MQRAWAAKEGIDLAMGKGRIPRQYFDAISEVPELAAELDFSTNTVRKEKEALANSGRAKAGEP